MTTAVVTGMVDPQVVLIEARRHSPTGSAHDSLVPIGAWSRYDRPAPTLTGYDALLTGTQG